LVIIFISGPDWTYETQDGETNGIGEVLGLENDKIVEVSYIHVH